MQAFIDRFKAKATKAAQAQSRVKALAKMQPIAAQMEERVAPFHLPQPAEAARQPAAALRGARPSATLPDRPVLQGLNLRIDHDDRIALLGQNGNGKSTFAKLIAGKLAPLAGSVYGAKRVDVGYFAQHQLDELNPLATPYDHMLQADAGRDGGAAAHAARHLRLLGRQGRHQVRQPLGRREGAAAAGARRLPRAAPADPRRADQPSRRRQPRSAGPRAQRISRAPSS